MTKQKTFDLLKLIRESYPSFQITHSIIDEWSKKFKHASLEGMRKRLGEIVADAKLPLQAVDFMITLQEVIGDSFVSQHFNTIFLTDGKRNLSPWIWKN
ncbi:hypothetical protein [Pseudoneobacillus sp. C159]